MKGLILSEQYYHEYGKQMIDSEFPQYKGRIAVGLVGDGSECYGFDDEISRDHDWGPGFCLWLEEKDYAEIAQGLRSAYDRLPREFQGFKRVTSKQGTERVGVFEISEFYRKFIGLPHAPKSIDRWLSLPEENMSACTNGKVFFDPLGKFTRIREELLGFYPEDVRLMKIAIGCIFCGQAGQYNFMRSVRHKEYFSAQYAETKFCADVMSLVFLLNRRWSPYYKWRHRAVRFLPLLGEFLHEKVGGIVAASNYEEKNAIIEEISAAVIRELQGQGLSYSRSDFLPDHAPVIQSNTKDKRLTKIKLWR